jgi:hypothetical protein
MSYVIGRIINVLEGALPLIICTIFATHTQRNVNDYCRNRYNYFCRNTCYEGVKKGAVITIQTISDFGRWRKEAGWIPKSFWIQRT